MMQPTTAENERTICNFDADDQADIVKRGAARAECGAQYRNHPDASFQNAQRFGEGFLAGTVFGVVLWCLAMGLVYLSRWVWQGRTI